MMQPATRSSATIHNLPVELLLEVFTYIAHLAYHCLPFGAAARGYQWTPLMFVCQRWRAIIVNASQFWTAVDFVDNWNWVELCLERSGRSSIDVRLVALPPKLLEAALPLLVAASVRIRSLTFQSYSETISSVFLQNLFCQPMHALENLSVSLDWGNNHQRPKIDLRLSFERHPRLRTLAVAGVPVLPIELSVYSRLQSLALHERTIPREGLSFQHLMRILRKASSQLQEIDLSHIDIPLPQVELGHPQDSPIHFPELRGFYMENLDYLAASRILQMLALPVCTHFHLRVYINSMIDGSFRSHLLRLIPQNIRPLLNTSVELVISMTDNTYTVRDPSLHSPHAVGLGDAHLHRVYISVSGLTVLEPQIDDIVHIATLLHLTSLTISSTGQPVSGASAWTTLFSACPNLRTLVVAMHPPITLFLALTPTPTATLIPCPVLHTLSIDLYGYREAWGEQLLAVLQGRLGVASRLSALSLWEFPASSPHGSQITRELRLLVGELTVS